MNYFFQEFVEKNTYTSFNVSISRPYLITVYVLEKENSLAGTWEWKWFKFITIKKIQNHRLVRIKETSLFTTSHEI